MVELELSQWLRGSQPVGADAAGTCAEAPRRTPLPGAQAESIRPKGSGGPTLPHPPTHTHTCPPTLRWYDDSSLGARFSVASTAWSALCVAQRRVAQG